MSALDALFGSVSDDTETGGNAAETLSLLSTRRGAFAPSAVATASVDDAFTGSNNQPVGAMPGSNASAPEPGFSKEMRSIPYSITGTLFPGSTMAMLLPDTGADGLSEKARAIYNAMIFVFVLFPTTFRLVRLVYPTAADVTAALMKVEKAKHNRSICPYTYGVAMKLQALNGSADGDTHVATPSSVLLERAKEINTATSADGSGWLDTSNWEEIRRIMERISSENNAIVDDETDMEQGEKDAEDSTIDMTRVTASPLITPFLPGGSPSIVVLSVMDPAKSVWKNVVTREGPVTVASGMAIALDAWRVSSSGGEHDVKEQAFARSLSASERQKALRHATSVPRTAAQAKTGEPAAHTRGRKRGRSGGREVNYAEAGENDDEEEDEEESAVSPMQKAAQDANAYVAKVRSLSNQAFSHPKKPKRDLHNWRLPMSDMTLEECMWEAGPLRSCIPGAEEISVAGSVVGRVPLSAHDEAEESKKLIQGVYDLAGTAKAIPRPIIAGGDPAAFSAGWSSSCDAAEIKSRGRDVMRSARALAKNGAKRLGSSTEIMSLELLMALLSFSEVCTSGGLGPEWSKPSGTPMGPLVVSIPVPGSDKPHVVYGPAASFIGLLPNKIDGSTTIARLDPVAVAAVVLERVDSLLKSGWTRDGYSGDTERAFVCAEGKADKHKACPVYSHISKSLGAVADQFSVETLGIQEVERTLLCLSTVGGVNAAIHSVRRTVEATVKPALALLESFFSADSSQMWADALEVMNRDSSGGVRGRKMISGKTSEALLGRGGGGGGRGGKRNGASIQMGVAECVDMDRMREDARKASTLYNADVSEPGRPGDGDISTMDEHLTRAFKRLRNEDKSILALYDTRERIEKVLLGGLTVANGADPVSAIGACIVGRMRLAMSDEAASSVVDMVLANTASIPDTDKNRVKVELADDFRSGIFTLIAVYLYVGDACAVVSRLMRETMARSYQTALLADSVSSKDSHFAAIGACMRERIGRPPVVVIPSHGGVSPTTDYLSTLGCDSEEIGNIIQGIPDHVTTVLRFYGRYLRGEDNGTHMAKISLKAAGKSMRLNQIVEQMAPKGTIKKMTRDSDAVVVREGNWRFMGIAYVDGCRRLADASNNYVGDNPKTGVQEHASMGAFKDLLTNGLTESVCVVEGKDGLVTKTMRFDFHGGIVAADMNNNLKNMQHSLLSRFTISTPVPIPVPLASGVTPAACPPTRQPKRVVNDFIYRNQEIVCGLFVAGQIAEAGIMDRPTAFFAQETIREMHRMCPWLDAVETRKYQSTILMARITGATAAINEVCFRPLALHKPGAAKTTSTQSSLEGDHNAKGSRSPSPPTEEVQPHEGITRKQFGLDTCAEAVSSLAGAASDSACIFGISSTIGHIIPPGVPVLSAMANYTYRRSDFFMLPRLESCVQHHFSACASVREVIDSLFEQQGDVDQRKTALNKAAGSLATAFERHWRAREVISRDTDEEDKRDNTDKLSMMGAYLLLNDLSPAVGGSVAQQRLGFDSIWGEQTIHDLEARFVRENSAVVNRNSVKSESGEPVPMTMAQLVQMKAAMAMADMDRTSRDVSTVPAIKVVKGDGTDSLYVHVSLLMGGVGVDQQILLAAARRVMGRYDERKMTHAYGSSVILATPFAPDQSNLFTSANVMRDGMYVPPCVPVELCGRGGGGSVSRFGFLSAPPSGVDRRVAGSSAITTRDGFSAPDPLSVAEKAGRSMLAIAEKWKPKLSSSDMLKVPASRDLSAGCTISNTGRLVAKDELSAGFREGFDVSPAYARMWNGSSDTSHTMKGRSLHEHDDASPERFHAEVVKNLLSNLGSDVKGTMLQAISDVETGRGGLVVDGPKITDVYLAILRYNEERPLQGQGHRVSMQMLLEALLKSFRPGVDLVATVREECRDLAAHQIRAALASMSDRVSTVSYLEGLFGMTVHAPPKSYAGGGYGMFSACPENDLKIVSEAVTRMAKTRAAMYSPAIDVCGDKKETSNVCKSTLNGNSDALERSAKLYKDAADAVKELTRKREMALDAVALCCVRVMEIVAASDPPSDSIILRRRSIYGSSIGSDFKNALLIAGIVARAPYSFAHGETRAAAEAIDGEYITHALAATAKSSINKEAYGYTYEGELTMIKNRNLRMACQESVPAEYPYDYSFVRGVPAPVDETLIGDEGRNPADYIVEFRIFRYFNRSDMYSMLLNNEKKGQ